MIMTSGPDLWNFQSATEFVPSQDKLPYGGAQLCIVKLLEIVWELDYTYLEDE
jgi:hypothetical protein